MKTVMELLEPLMDLDGRVSAPAKEFQSEAVSHVENVEPSRESRHLLTLQYRTYMELVRGAVRSQLDVPREWDVETGEGLRAYATHYLPYEILSWGGDVRGMFPKTCDVLDRHGISLTRFVEFWFAYPRTSETGYDFFLLKIDLFVKFLGQVFPEAGSTVKQEAELLAQGYLLACQGTST
jgi:uncharacterized protein